MGWPDRTPELAKFYPTSVLVTGYDILFFWVARMMMFGTFVGDDDAITLGRRKRGPQVPFENVFLHGLIRDEFGRKMSKSKGNGIDPLDWVEMFGADALRFTLARGASPGGDLSIGEDHARASRNFATKLFNATRFALMNGAAPAPLPEPSSPTPTAGSSVGWKRFAPRWIRRSTATSSAGPASRSTTSPGTSSATGTSSWRKCSWRRDCRAHHGGAAAVLDTCSSCCTR